MKLKRNTLQKQLILNAVCTLKNHASADEVFDYIIDKYPTISRTTVYRNLNQLALIGEIQKVEIPNCADRYDHLTYNHYHAKCSNCLKIVDIEMEDINNFEDNIKNDNGFEIRGHDIIFNGICAKCFEKKGITRPNLAKI